MRVQGNRIWRSGPYLDRTQLHLEGRGILCGSTTLGCCQTIAILRSVTLGQNLPGSTFEQRPQHVALTE